MTREEAIQIIEVVFKSKEAYKHNDSVTHQALNMAIEALSAEAEQVTGKLNSPCDSLLKSDSDECKEQKSKSDLISRQDELEQLCEDCRSISAQDCEYKDVCKTRRFILSFPSVDAVQIPIKLEKRYPQSRDEDITDAFMRGYLAGRSSADRPTGEWVSEDGTPSEASYSVYCSRCGQWSEYRGFFCLWCGAKMGGDTE